MRTFIAVDIPGWVGERIAEIQEKLERPGIKLVERENLHITIVFLGEKSIPEIEEIKHSLNFLKTFSAVKAKLHGLSWFPANGKPRVVYVDVHSRQFIELAETIRARFGIDEDFTPHLTIARVKGYVDNKFMDMLESMKDVFIGEITVNEVKLKKSVLLPTRPVYTDMFTWKLQSSD